MQILGVKAAAEDTDHKDPRPTQPAAKPRPKQLVYMGIPAGMTDWHGLLHKHFQDSWHMLDVAHAAVGSSFLVPNAPTHSNAPCMPAGQDP